MGRPARRAAALCTLLLAGACELTEVVTPAGGDLLVVEGVLRAGDGRQRILLHRSLNGVVVRGETDARVSVQEVGGGETVFVERPVQECTDQLFPEMTDSLEVRATCYLENLRVEPGRTYELHVETAGGEVARGRTTVPGAFRLVRPAPPAGAPHACSLPPYTNLEVRWQRSRGAWSYIAALEITGLRLALAPQGIVAPERLELSGVSISESDTVLVVPAEVGLFERVELGQELLRLLQRGFPPGVSARLVVVAADRNYVNSVRGGGFNPSGNVRISSVVGDAVGVFGSAVPAELFILSETEGYYPACGQ